MSLNKSERVYLSEEIAILLTETYAVGKTVAHMPGVEGNPPGFIHATESSVRATIKEAIDRALDSRIVLREP